MEDIKRLYEECINSYSNLNVIDKRKELLLRLEKLSSDLYELTESLDKKQNEFTGKFKLDNDLVNADEDVFLTSVFTYSYALENQISNLLKQLIDIE